MCFDRTREASHGRRPWLLIGDIPDHKRRQPDQSAESRISYANICPIECHREPRPSLDQ